MYVINIATTTGVTSGYPIDRDAAEEMFEKAANRPDTIFACFGEFGCGLGEMGNVFVAPETGFKA